MRRASIAFALTVAALAQMAPSSASAQRMDLALSRLRTPAVEGTDCSPGVGMASERQFCPDDQAWHSLAAQFAGALMPPILLPAHTRGMRGIYVGIESFITGIDSGQEYWARGTEGDAAPDPSDPAAPGRNDFVDGVLAWNRLNVRKGLPFGFEIGTNVGFLVNTAYWTLGLEVRWSLFEGFRLENTGFYFPSLSVRGSVQTLIGDSELNITVPAVDVTLGERFVVADTVEISPYLGAQLAWIFADTELVDLTPERDAFADCRPDPALPTTGTPPYCTGEPDDINNNAVFDSLRSMRARLFVGTQVRYEWFALTAAFAFDVVTPGELDGEVPADVPRQWQVDVGAGVSY